MQRGLSLVLVTLVCGVARADEPPTPPAAPAAPAPSPAPVAKPASPSTPEQAADAVLAAIQTKDDAALKSLAGREDPDPWLVADQLIRRGEFDAAEVFAKVAPRKLAEKLPAYVASRRGKPDDPARRARALAGDAARAEGKPQGALDAYGPPEVAPLDDVLGNSLLVGRANALRELNRPRESAAAFLVAADAAERLGWPDRAYRALHQAGWSAAAASDARQSVSAWERCLRIVEPLERAPMVAIVRAELGDGYQRLGDPTKALPCYERALAANEALGDKIGTADALAILGGVHAQLGDHTKALEVLERALAAMEALGDKESVATTLANIADLLVDLGELDPALSFAKRARAAKAALGRKTHAAESLFVVGKVHEARGELG